jgi:hypothetical protein
MRNNNQSGRGSGSDGGTTTDTDGTGFGSPSSGGPGFGGGKRPWFGPKRIGWGYRPQTWQGWLVTAIMVAVLIGTATVAQGAPWFFVVVVAVVAVPFIIIAAQRR